MCGEPQGGHPPRAATRLNIYPVGRARGGGCLSRERRGDACPESFTIAFLGCLNQFESLRYSANFVMIRHESILGYGSQTPLAESIKGEMATIRSYHVHETEVLQARCELGVASRSLLKSPVVIRTQTRTFWLDGNALENATSAALIEKLERRELIPFSLPHVIFETGLDVFVTDLNVMSHSKTANKQTVDAYLDVGRQRRHAPPHGGVQRALALSGETDK
ncbi:hypothetical protein EVAR_62337_1 [Eumeta japonica]|uniref:Uncharacterized protein n=1 Tax=Eumeta variegata TaxID=151549 RepID=A0A4C1ZP27_EUMVA|nr:hypothetical protein EVAR_62337_1 [Eumeta japonica]